MNEYIVKKALKRCSAVGPKTGCSDCPYCYRCKDLNREALCIITEQEKEIERLRTTLRQCNTELNNALESLKSQCREIGELKAENDNLNLDYRNAFERLKSQQQEIDMLKDDYAKLQELFAQYQMASDKEIRAQIKQAKIDVLYELKEKRTTVFIDIDEVDKAVFIDDIDELLKEVKNER